MTESQSGDKRAPAISRRGFLAGVGAAVAVARPRRAHAAEAYSLYGPITALAIAPDGRRLAFAQGWRIAVVDLKSGAVDFLPPVHEGRVDALSFSLRGGVLASGGADGAAVAWRDGKVVGRSRFDGRVSSVAVLSADSSVVAGLWDGRVVFPTASGGKAIQGHRFGTVRIDLSPDEESVVSGGDDQTVSLWSSRTGDRLRSFRAPGLGVKAHRGRAGAIFVSQDRLLTGGIPARSDPALALWDVGTARVLRTYVAPAQRALLQGAGAECLSVSSDGRIAAYLPLIGVARLALFDVTSWTRIVESVSDGALFLNAALAPNGLFCAVGTDAGTVLFYDVERRRAVASMVREEDALKTRSFAGGAAETTLPAALSPFMGAR